MAKRNSIWTEAAAALFGKAPSKVTRKDVKRTKRLMTDMKGKKK